MKFSLLVITLLIASCASNSSKKMDAETTQAKAAKAKKEVKKATMKASTSAKTCSSAGDTRTIEVKKVDSGCEVLYTKLGETKSIASAQYDLSHCDAVQDKVTSNLSGAGFKCE